ncbi:cold shock domain protein 1 [Artemisia annua]|uniref:Cold shock domain protein 1 n=1 Tax=Artemisia annua TaxID=35608 RepID=A0A2U1N3W2_ARTAN|nr:cold shock domain protein 1 [Artemisia annua]
MGRNIFKAIREGRIIQTVMYKGIGEAAKNFDIPISEVNKIVLKAMQSHKDLIKRHQDSIAKLHNEIQDFEEKERVMELKSCISDSDNVCCYFCGESGHIAKDCSCFKCGVSGHLAKDCTDDGDGHGGRKGRGRNGGCYKCGQVEHIPRYCNQIGVGGGGCVCYYCGESGHIAYECSEGCSVCGKTGHMAKDCPDVNCFWCRQVGHYETECPRSSGSSGVACYKCGYEGHMARHCNEAWGGGGGGRLMIGIGTKKDKDPQGFCNTRLLDREVSAELLEAQVNPAVWKISGHMVLKCKKDFDGATGENINQTCFGLERETRK